MCVSLLQRIPTGCKTIDEILGGGISIGDVDLIYGAAETGKTTLAMQCAVNCARKSFKTLFIDSDGSFSARRLSQVAAEYFEKVVQLIILAKPNNLSEQTLIIDRLADYVTKDFKLIIIDTVTSLYSAKVAEFPEKTFELNRELSRQMACLAQFAKTQKVALLITSQVRTVFNKNYVSVEPVATRVLKFWADTIIAMKPTENPRIIKAVLEKNPNETKPLTCYLEIGETGIREHSNP
jgi:DNA repair protein RadB